MKKSAIVGLAMILAAACITATTAAESAATAPATAPAAVDMKNTKCLVAKDDVGDSKLTVTYKGKLYHLCCADCQKEFNENPDRFVNAFAKDPAAYGVAK